MERRGGSDGPDRDGAARAVAILSLYEDGFLSGLRENPESTLWSYGFALSPRELETIREAFGTAQARSLGNDEILRIIEEGFQVEARRWPW